MFAPVAGLITLMLFVFDPTVLVNAPFVATNTGAAFGFFATVYTFYRFVKKMTWPRAILCGLAVGIAFASKHSTILLVPMIVLLGAGELAGRWKANRDWPKREAIRLVLGVATIFAVALFVLWGEYGPEPGKGPEHSHREGAGQVILL